MTTRRHTQLHLARVTLELTSPLAIGLGRNDDFVDALFITDASGLPTLPGTSLAGVCRALWRAVKGSPQADAVFGFQRSGKVPAGEPDGAVSRLSFSFGVIHDQDDHPVRPRLLRKELEADPVLRCARTPIVRQHVRIDHRGVADSSGHGLYNQSVVAAGHRFTFEVSSDLPETEDPLAELLACLKAGDVRLGGKTRSGLGAFRVVRVLGRRFDLSKPADYEAFSRLPAGIHQPAPPDVLPVVQGLDASASGAHAVAELRLTPLGTWMVGGGTPTEEDASPTDRNKMLDMIPYRELRVRWEGGRGRVDEGRPVVVVPATAIKGAVRHRTTFHLNRLEQAYADWIDDPEERKKRFSDENPGIVDLFGTAVQHEEESGRAGRVVFSDLALTEAPRRAAQAHVSLDRFTSGPLDGALYEEAPFWKGPEWVLQVRLTDPGAVDPVAAEALGLALRDLAEGRLQIGAGSGRGHGWVKGALSWSRPGPWTLTKEAEHA